jgi:serpin B
MPSLSSDQALEDKLKNPHHASYAGQFQMIWRYPRAIAIFLLPLLLLALLIPGPAPCAHPNPESEAAANAINAFGVDLYGQIQKPDGNLIYSPYSISMCLAMAYAGARGNTESQMAKVLHLNLPQPKVSEAFSAVNARVLAGSAEDIETYLVYGLLEEKSSPPLLKEYLESIRPFTNQSDRFSSVPVVGGFLRSLWGDDRADFRMLPDFRGIPIKIKTEDQTKNRINDLSQPGSITPDTLLVINNDIYFKGKWAKEFRQYQTKQDSFTLLYGKEIRVPMMHQTDAFGYMAGPDLQVLEMPYKDGKLSMFVLLPSKERRLEEFEQSLTSEKLNQVIGNLRKEEVEVFFPKFRMVSRLTLEAVLTKLGMTDAFSKNADFSGMTGKRHLFMLEFRHKAVWETNQEGTDAAGTTATIARPGGPLPVLRADHPFVFLILHRPTNCIVFMGRVTKP